MGDNLAHGTLGHDMVIAYHGVAPSKSKTINLTKLNYTNVQCKINQWRDTHVGW